MKFKKYARGVTFLIALLWLVTLSLYSSMLMGSLAHELMHKSYSIDTEVIVVNYDGSGFAKGEFFGHSHSWVYFNGTVVETFMILITIGSFVVVVMK